MKQAAGFTLLELMVVMVLIGLITAMILPEMKGTFQDMLLRSTARDLVSAFALASSQAITLNQTHRVRLDHLSGRYIVERAAPKSDAASAFEPSADLPGAKGQLDPRIRIEIRKPNQEAGRDADEEGGGRAGFPGRPGDSDAFAFYADGTAEPGEVVLEDQEGFKLGLRINPITARVRVVELPRR
jgi:type II secretion system protein H